MDEKNAIEVNNIGKAYQMFDSPSKRLQQSFSNKKLYTEFWALKDVSFSISKGSVVGIVGRNGSGKSTLLQILAGTLKPTEGTFTVNGKIAALLELGSGFNPEFTGKENVFLSGSIYGITEAEMKKRFDKIQAFADIGEFINQPVKTYSSGMFARLAFAVNINVSADILIIDEVLSVGDHFFQAKCMEAINELVRSGTTILLVSHSQATIKSICDSAILFNKGSLIKQGGCDDVLDEYMSLCLSEEREYQRQKALAEQQGIAIESSKHLLQRVPKSSVMPQYSKRITGHFGTEKMRFVEAMIFQNNRETTVIENRKDCCISAWVEVCEDIPNNSEIGIVVRTFEGIDMFALNTYFKGKPIPPVKRGTVFRVDFTFKVMLGAGRYSVTLGIRTPIQGEYSDKSFNAIIFDVVDSTSNTIPLLFDVPFDIKMTI